MPYLVLLMEGLTVAWFVIMLLHVTDLHRWSLTVPEGRMDEVGRAIQTSAKWAFPVGMAILVVLTVIELAQLAAY